MIELLKTDKSGKDKLHMPLAEIAKEAAEEPDAWFELHSVGYGLDDLKCIMDDHNRRSSIYKLTSRITTSETGLICWYVRANVDEDGMNSEKWVEKYGRRIYKLSARVGEIAQENGFWDEDDVAEKAKLKSWMEPMNKLVNKYGYGKVEILLEWFAMDDFWNGVVEAPKGLEKNYEKIRSSANRDITKNPDKMDKIRSMLT